MIVNLDKNLFVSEEGILKQVSKKKKITLLQRLIKYLKARKNAILEKQFNEEFEEDKLGKKVCEEIRDENDEEKLTEEEERDVGILLNLADHIAERMIEMYFEFKERKERNGKYDE